jgi:CubicO group peptidase (beta-lactamase class C family)
MSRLAAFLVIAACGHNGGAAEPDSALAPDGASSDPRAAAAETTATTNSLCTKIAPFYWEIGDASGAIASGAVGAGVDAHTTMNIASASKLVFGAYVVERFESDLTQADYQAMTMRSGYVSFDYESCVGATTVDDCLAKNNNGTQTPSAIDHFDYDGGHFQHYASASLGLGPDDAAALAQVMGLPYGSPQLAAGIATTPSDYAAFLRKILSGQLAIRDHLSDDPVCTVKSAPCNAIYSPAAPYAWHYSWGHWIEDDASMGDDGAFSSPGAFGFYPWIDASRTYYGVLARDDEKLADALSAYKDSVYCGRSIRKAFLTATAQ